MIDRHCVPSFRVCEKPCARDCFWVLCVWWSRVTVWECSYPSYWILRAVLLFMFIINWLLIINIKITNITCFLLRRFMMDDNGQRKMTQGQNWTKIKLVTLLLLATFATSTFTQTNEAILLVGMVSCFTYDGHR